MKIATASLFFAIATIALFPEEVQAGQSSGILHVSLQITDSCNVRADPLDFTLERGGVGGATAETEVEVRCTPNAEYSVSLDDGSNAKAGNRQLLNTETGETIGYDVYLDPSRSRRWGGAQSESMSGTVGEAGDKVIKVYGYVPRPQITPASGQFSDSLVMTIHF